MRTKKPNQKVKDETLDEIIAALEKDLIAAGHNCDSEGCHNPPQKTKDRCYWCNGVEGEIVVGSYERDDCLPACWSCIDHMFPG